MLASFKKQQKKAIREAKLDWFDNYYIYMPKRLTQYIDNNGERIPCLLYFFERCNAALFANSMSNP
jgi:hypothetical protein